MRLEGFFNPDSVAVVGASRQPGKVGHAILTALIEGGFEGDIFPVNPNADEIAGRKAYPDLASIEPTPGLVVVAVPAKAVEGVIKDCAAAGARSVIVVSAGFRETGSRGRQLEQAVVRAAQRADIRVLGPNCLGLMVPGHKLNASFAGDMPQPGGIGYFSQSGSLLAAILDMAKSEDIGFSRLVSIGNKADIDEHEIIRAYGEDAETKVIAGYLEDLKDGQLFLREAEQMSREKPILLVKSGDTGAGARAASSHTGALAMEAAEQVVFERAGIIRCHSIKAQFDYARALATQPLPEAPTVAVIANGGGPSILAADAIESEGLTLAELDEETAEKLKDVLPPDAGIRNPIDVLGDARARRFEGALRAALESDGIAAGLIMLTPHATAEVERTAEATVAVAGEMGKPVFACFLGGDSVSEGIRVLRRGGIPCYDSPEAAVRTIKVMSDYARWRQRPKRVVKLFPVNRRKVEQVIDRKQREGETEIGEMDAKDILDAYGFVIPRGAVATTAEQAANIASQIGYPVVLKIWSPDILNKSEVGGIRVGLTSPQEIKDAFDLMMYRIPKRAPNADILGVLVEEMCTRGQELMLGMTRDPRYGPLMMFGQGGVLVEMMRDVAFYLAPITADEAREMLRSTRTYRLLRGDGDQPRVDIDAVAEDLQRLSQLVTEFGQIEQMEINPYVVGPRGTRPVAVDAHLTIKKAD